MIPAAPSFLITGGRLVDPSQNLDRVARLLVIDGQVEAIDPADGEIPSNIEHIDASGKIVAPGLVDLGVELREPGFEEDETIASGSDAALAGGFTSILACSSTSPCIDSHGAVEFVRQKAVQADGVRVHVIGCLSKNRDAQQMAELGLLHEAGAVAYSDSPRPMPNDALLKRALEYAQMFDLPIINRPNVMTLSEGGIMHDGQVALVLGLKGLPTEAEDLAVARDVRIAEATNGRLHIGPVSTMGAVDLISRVKERGINITASVCPHNLCLDDTHLRSFDARFKVHPPLRSPRHIETLRNAVADGTIDAIQSGHMPRAREKKMDDLFESPFGLASLETTLSTVATFMLGINGFDWLAIIDRLSTAPARIAGIAGGTLAVGSPADITIIDPDDKWTVDGHQFKSHCISTPLDNIELTSRVTHTFVGGRLRFSLRPELSHLA
ncbi:dihydroorotase [Rubripirellula reticaptiva]|uniref:Dihydroorotase n=1 Tax=Rubripirellula reticaptiva TaxID=2528013 RepID=A0A5C6F506_9BACT|nr:dihydroorotase [Rubripirellula reticaptiva]TWU56132.1 Dihydroorotase [Rubripirellula reticaptiva]